MLTKAYIPNNKVSMSIDTRAMYKNNYYFLSTFYDIEVVRSIGVLDNIIIIIDDGKKIQEK